MALKGKNIVITGCLKGIGRATLETFAKNHANIWACCQNEDQEFLDSIQKIPIYETYIKKGLKINEDVLSLFSNFKSIIVKNETLYIIGLINSIYKNDNTLIGDDIKTPGYLLNKNFKPYLTF